MAGEASEFCFVYDSTKEVFDKRWPAWPELPDWRNTQFTKPPLMSVIVAPVPGNAASLFAEHYGGRMFRDVCYNSVRVERQEGLRPGDICHAAQMILRRHKKMLKEHREDGRLVEHLEEFDDDVDIVEFWIEVEVRRAVASTLAPGEA